VWLGNDDDTPMNKVTGGSLPAAAWRGFMLAATKGMPVKPLPIPAAILATPPPAAESPLDRLFGWLGAPSGLAPGPLPVDAGHYPGTARQD